MWCLQSAGKFSVSSLGQGFFKFSMRGRHVDAYSAYKRVTSRDYYNAYDREEDSGASPIALSSILMVGHS